MKMRIWARLASLAGAALALGIGAAAMATPSTISYVGELRAENGLLYSGSVQVEATLYTSATGGSPARATEDLGMVQASNGLIRLNIGASGSPIGQALLAEENLWLELSIDGVTLSPRQRLSSVAYARQSADAKSLGTLDAAGYATNAAVAARPSTASSGAAAPSSPAAGMLWWDAPNKNLFIWDGGASAWVPVSATEVKPENLPGNGLAAMSNGMMSNEFEGVQHQWTTGTPIADANNIGPGTPAVAEIAVTEGSQSYIYGIEIQTQFSLTSANNIQMRLVPPSGTGVAPITLRNGSLPFGAYGDIWNISNTPELEALLGTNPQGPWALVVQDFDNNLVNPGVAGTLNSFTIVYNVVRSDNMQANGTLEVERLRVRGALMADITVDGDLSTSSNFDTTGRIVRTVPNVTTSAAATDAAGVQRSAQFVKKHDDTWLRIEWNEGAIINTTTTSSYTIQVNGNTCLTPLNWISYQRLNTVAAGNIYEASQVHWVAYCKRVNNITPVPGVNGGVNIPAGTYTIGISQSGASMQIGWNNRYGSISVEEVYID